MTAGAAPSAALLSLHLLTFDCLYVLHDKDIGAAGPLWQLVLLGSLPAQVNLAAGPHVKRALFTARGLRGGVDGCFEGRFRESQ